MKDDDDAAAQLDYASPPEMPPGPRPPMYSLVLCVLFGAFLVAFGGVMLAGAAALLFGAGVENWPWALLLLLPLGAAMLAAGVVTFVDTVHALRGSRPRDPRWERWAALLNRSFMDGRAACPTCGARRPPRGACPGCGLLLPLPPPPAGPRD